ncbi:MAG: hypothetical protein AB2693_31830 [Candidatus Thiodiazotropha sp.]
MSPIPPDINDVEKEVRRRLIVLTGSSDILSIVRRTYNHLSEIKPIIQSVCAYVESSVPGLESFWLGYRLTAASDVNEYVFVAQVADKKLQLPTVFCSLQIIKRHASQISKEATATAASEGEEKLRFTDSEHLRIRECLTKNTSKLMKEHTNLLIISASNIKSKGFNSKEAILKMQICIALYVQIKGIIPFGENHFPTNLDGFPVDVREGRFTTYSKNPDDFHERLLMGCQIVTAYNTCGTLGGFVYLENGNVGCLTCCHVFETPESTEDYNKDPDSHAHVKRDVFQPAPQTEFKFGNLIKFINEAGHSADIGVDAALIEIINPFRIPTAGEFPNATSSVTGNCYTSLCNKFSLSVIFYVVIANFRDTSIYKLTTFLQNF